MTGHQKNKPWRVVRRRSAGEGVEVSAHRWEWQAMRRARREERTTGLGVWFIVQEVRS